ncbi:hypothetical protein Hypma_003241 [Hypsizygus marmoreus]|uniref:Uncharacterized protein n=1 Tax=Hypsizygus marmoreus TaxID=39966 RepID=A0A369K2R2_HYPMA|nr:hypothetical protein Hypma_003241 [Hypsizygus marmoreus]
MAPSLRLIHLVAVMCESLLVGAYAVLVGLITWILVHGHRTMPTMHKVLFGASIFMFVISAVHLGLVMQEISAEKDFPVGNFQTQIVFSVFQFVIGDLILIWRVWVIWGCNYFVAAGPLAVMIVAAGLTFNLATGTETRSFFTAAPAALIVANTSVCTLLIAGRIWYMRYQLKKSAGNAGTLHTSSSYKGAFALIIESGALYALAQLCSLILDHVGSIGLPIMLDLEIPLIGILPTLIIVFVHFNMVPGTKTTQSYAQSMQFQDRSHVTMNTNTSGSITIGDTMAFKSGTMGSSSSAFDITDNERRELKTKSSLYDLDRATARHGQYYPPPSANFWHRDSTGLDIAQFKSGLSVISALCSWSGRVVKKPLLREGGRIKDPERLIDSHIEDVHFLKLRRKRKKGNCR